MHETTRWLCPIIGARFAFSYDELQEQQEGLAAAGGEACDGYLYTKQWEQSARNECRLHQQDFINKRHLTAALPRRKRVHGTMCKASNTRRRIVLIRGLIHHARVKHIETVNSARFNRTRGHRRRHAHQGNFAERHDRSQEDGIDQDVSDIRGLAEWECWK